MSRSSWMIAFADLAAVLAGFFVLLLSMSNFDTPRVEDLLDDLGKAKGNWSLVRTEAPQPASGVLRDLQDLPGNTRYLATVIRAEAEAGNWPLNVRSTDLGVLLRPRGDAEDLTPDFLPILGDYLSGSGLDVSVRALFPADAAARASGFGVYDVGLVRARDAARALGAGLDGAVPIETRIDADLDTFRLEIAVRQPLEPKT